MSILRRILGVFVMIAGVIGLLLSLAGLVGVWMARPSLSATINSTVSTLSTTIDTSQKTMAVTGQALGGAIQSIDALSVMLGTTATTVEETQPVITNVNNLMGKTLPSTFTAATDSLAAAEDAAQSLEEAMKSFDTFRAVMAATPFLSAMVPPSTQSYNPDKPLADSLGELAASIEEMPATFELMAADMDKADNNLEAIRGDLNTMSTNVALISASLSEYEAMIGESQASMEDLRSMLTGIQANSDRIITISVAVLTLFFLWLLAAQAVIFSQGWELFQGTAGRMEGAPEPVIVETTVVESTPEV